jgi:hypothetical protein
MLHALLLMVLASAATVTEPNTQVTFDATMVVGDQTLQLTGVDRRRALGRDAYAVAHYIVGTPEEAPGPDARLTHYIDTPAHKVLIFHGVYKSVPAHGIRHSWKKHFKDLGMTPREDFIEAFQSPFARGERLYFIASPDGRLEVRHDDKIIGQWNDPTLVRALWAMCLGPTTEIVDRMKLASRNPAPEEIAARETEKETPRP